MRTLCLALLAAAALIAATAAPTSASTYCVAPKTGCGTGNDFGTIAAGLAAAAGNPGADTVKLGAATYRENGLRYDGADPVTLLGAGRDLTTVQRATPLAGSTTLAGSGPLNLRSLRVRLLAADDVRPFDTEGTLFEDLRIDAEPAATNATGAQLDADRVVLRDAEIELPTGGQCLVLNVDAGETAHVEDVRIDGCSTGVRHAGGGTSTLARLHVETNYGIDSGAGILVLDDSLLLISSSGTGIGLSQGSSTHTEVLVRQSTIVGRGSGDGLVNFNHLAPTSSHITAFDTIVRGFGQSVVRDPGAGTTTTMLLDYVSYDRDTVVSPVGMGTLNTSNSYDDPDPRFVDPAGGNYRLAADSPLVDQDNIPLFDTAPAEPLTDFDGTLRIVNGRRDLGAFERALAPAVTGGDASAIGVDAATIGGLLDTGGAIGSWKVLYGPTAAYGSATAPQALPAALGSQAASVALAGLSAGTGYHYALQLTTLMGTVTGADRTFTTAVARSAPGPGAPGPGPAAGPARLTRLKLAPAAFTAADRGATIAAAGGRRGPPVGSRLTFALTTDAAVAFTVRRLARGVRSGGRCLTPRRGRRGRRCTRELVVGRAFAYAARAGRASLRFSGRVGGRRLSPGRYVLVAQPAGGTVARIGFRILRAR
jgi:hypothetical protein